MATWNVQGLNTKKKEVFQEIERMKLDVCVLTETKKKGKGNEQIGKYIHFYSGVNKTQRAKRGVSIVVHQKLKNYIKEWEELDERIIKLELQKGGHKIVIIGVYAPTDDSDVEVKEEFFNKLTQVLSDVNPRKELILMGDLNGRTGRADDSLVVGKYGELNLNNNGERLIGLCENFSLKIQNGFFPHKKIHQYTWHQPTRDLRSIIDYIIQRQKTNIQTTDVRAYRGPECGTDHFMVRASMVLNYKDTKIQGNKDDTRNIETIRYNLESLKQDSIKFLYKTRLATKLQQPLEGSAAARYEQIKEAIHNAANEAVGRWYSGSAKTQEWWTKELEEKVKLKKWAYNKWLNTKDAEDRKLYARMNREVKREVAKNKNCMWERRCEEVDRYMGGTKISEAWKMIKNLRQEEKQRCNLSLIPLQQWEKYYTELLTETRDKFKGTEMRINPDNTDIEPISINELRKALKSSKNKKAAGPGDIPVELVKNGPDILLEEIVQVMNKCLIEGDDVPEDWNMGYMSSIHKKGSKTECKNYRGICVTSSMGRLYGRIIKSRLEENIVDIEEQSGFRRGRSCLDNIFTLKQVIEKRVARNIDTHIIFIDLEKAYDSVPLNKLFEVLTKRGISETYIRCIYKIYKNTECVVKVGSQISNRIKITKGLKQGCSMSPTLFKIYVQEAISEWCKKCSGMGIEMGQTNLYTMLFADDQIILANDEDDITYMMRKLLEELTEWGLQVNMNKTEYLCVGTSGTDLDIQGRTIKNTDKYKYLGSLITHDGKDDQDIEYRIRQGKTVIQQLNGLLWSTKLRFETKKLLYNCIVEPITTYGAETWNLTQRKKQRLKTVEMDFFRRSCRISRLEHIPNEVIKQRSQIEDTIVDRIEQRQLIWYGHVMRMGQTRLPRLATEYYPQNRRKRGRPAHTWTKGIEEAMTRRDLGQNDWQDRGLWRVRCGKRQQL